MTRLRNFWIAWSWGLLILILCLIPGKDLPSWGWADVVSLDKFVHAGMFGLLSIFIYRGFLVQYPEASKRSNHIAGALIISALYGVATEVMQGTLLTDRIADPMDQLANIVGIALAWYVITKKMWTKYYVPG